MSFASQLSAAFVPIDAVYDAAAVTRALSFAQSEVQGYCNRESFDLVTNEVVHIDPAPYRKALLPSVPVATVSLLRGLLPDPTGASTGFTWVTLTNYRFVAETGLIYDTSGEIGTSSWLGPTWPWLPGSLEVTYDHGYATIPQGLVDVACRFAQQYLENPALMMQRRVGEQEGRYAGSVGVVITELDKRILDRYRLIDF